MTTPRYPKGTTVYIHGDESACTVQAGPNDAGEYMVLKRSTAERDYSEWVHADRLRTTKNQPE